MNRPIHRAWMGDMSYYRTYHPEFGSDVYQPKVPDIKHFIEPFVTEKEAIAFLRGVYEMQLELYEMQLELKELRQYLKDAADLLEDWSGYASKAAYEQQEMGETIQKYRDLAKAGAVKI